MKYQILTEEDLSTLFSEKKKPSRNRLERLFLFLLIVVPVYFVLFLGINYSSISKSLSFWYKTEYKNEPAPAQTTNISAITIKKSNNISLPEIEDNHLLIDVIGINAPITWRVENTEDEVRKNLQNGLIHIKGTALPGEKGNTFITGHSSDLPWSKGHYKTVFALLNKLVVGDIIQVKYQNANYVYKVSDIKTVAPDDLSVMDQTKTPTLTLMTCTPIGTNLKRLIITAPQIYPSTDSAQTPADAKNQANQLPKAR